MKSHWITHKGKRVFFEDFSNFQDDVAALKAEADEVFALLSREPENSVLLLVDSRNTTGSLEMMGFLKTHVNRIQPPLKKQAVIGVTGVRKVLLQTLSLLVKRPMEPFGDNVEDAKDWLVSDT